MPNVALKQCSWKRSFRASPRRHMRRTNASHRSTFLQGNGFFTKSSTAGGIRQTRCENGGFLVDARYRLSRWFSAGITWRRNRVTDRYSAPQFSSVQAIVSQFLGGFTVHLPIVSKLNPSLLAQGGALLFAPTDSGALVRTTRQASGTLGYGGASISHNPAYCFAWRIPRPRIQHPVFNISTLNASSVRHTAEPSAGVVLSF